MQSYLRENIEPQFELMIQSASMIDWLCLFLPFLLGLLHFIKPMDTRIGVQWYGKGLFGTVWFYGFIKAYQTADITFAIQGCINAWIIGLTLQLLLIKDLQKSSEEE